jgi:hypothetical protein
MSGDFAKALRGDQCNRSISEPTIYTLDQLEDVFWIELQRPVLKCAVYLPTGSRSGF